MRITTLPVAAALVVLAVLPAQSAHAQWTRDGASPCGSPSCLGSPTTIASDGAGGVVFGKWEVSYFDNSSGSYFYVDNLQRVTADGLRSPGWAEQGAFLGLKGMAEFGAVVRGDHGGFLYLSTSLIPASATNLSGVYAYRVNDDGSFPAGWDSSGSLLSSPTSSVGFVHACSDGGGGYYVTWDQQSAAGADVLLQHMDQSGQIVPGWPANGLRLNHGLLNALPQVVPDGQNGAIVVEETDDSAANQYAFRVHSDGTLAWPGLPTGVLLGTGSAGYQFATAIPDGQGGAFAVMDFFTSNGQSDIFLQHVLASGSLAPGWPANGIRVTNVLGSKVGTIAVSDGGSGLYVGWFQSGPSSGYFIQHMLANGARATGWPNNGMPPATGPNFVDRGVIAPDGSGGLYCVLHEPYVNRVLLQHQSAAGLPSPGWPTGGVDACPDIPGGIYDENFMQITSDGAGGAITAWGRGDTFAGVVQLNRLGPVGVVATELSLVATQATPQAVTLQWFSGAAHSETYELQRMPQGGEWANLAALTPDGTGQLSYDDHSIVAGQRYGYRLMTIGAGAHVASPETWVSVPAAYRFALAGARPNPASRSNATVAFSLEPNAPASLEMYDLSGRRVLLEDVGALGAGDHVVPLSSDGRLAAGMYWLRLSQGAQRATARVVVVE